MFKDARLELILVVDHHHGVLIVVISLEARHADHSSSIFSILPKPSRQEGFSTTSTPAINGTRNERPATVGSEFNGFVRGLTPCTKATYYGIYMLNSTVDNIYDRLQIIFDMNPFAEFEYILGYRV